jgi:beta-ureidopropionase / N-carbamoyl-L-amino-acid hydrolase
LLSFDALWSDLEPIGRTTSGGYRRFAWTPEDLTLREWFAAEASARGLDVVLDRAGNQWAWLGNPDDEPGVVVGSHLDSVPEGGAFDGPLGVASSFAALDLLRDKGFAASKPIGVVNFADEEGARFGIACAGSRLITGALDADRGRALADSDGVTIAQAMASAGLDPAAVGRDDETLRRVGQFVELHVEQGKGLVELGSPIGVASAIWPHGRWRIDLPGQANHAGTTRIEDRHDAMLGYASVVLAARAAAVRHGAVATCGKVRVEPNGVNAIPSLVTGWLDSRGASARQVRDVVVEVTEAARSFGGTVTEESWTGETTFDIGLRDRIRSVLGGVPILPTGAGHDAGILANEGIPTAMVFVRNPTGVSHSPHEFAERDDCVAGVEALAQVLQELAG